MRLTFPSQCISTALALAVCCTSLHAQGPATPAFGAALKKTLSTSDKYFVKAIGEAELGMLHLADLTRGPEAPGSDPLKEMNSKLAVDLNNAWGELGTIAQGKGGQMPKTEPTATEKSNIANLRKIEKPKFEKTFLMNLTKESRKSTQVIDLQGKAVQDPELKMWVGKWGPIFKTHYDEISKAESEESKKK